MSLMLHCGGIPATENELRLIPVPKPTDTYTPVSHNKLINLVKDVVFQTGLYEFDSQGFGIRRDGKQLFAHLRYVPKEGADEQLGLCVGIVNSYDKSLIVRVASGAEVFICDNMALSGDITYMRKHTRHIWDDIEDAIRDQIYSAKNNYDTVVQDRDAMLKVHIDDTMANAVMGDLYGRKILSPTMLGIAHKSWSQPTHQQFAEPNKWSLYNACNYALKTTHPSKIVEKHIKLHEYFVGADLWDRLDTTMKN